MRKNLKSAATVCLAHPLPRVWQVVTNNADYRWRSDLARLELHPDGTWSEYDQAGHETCFRQAEKTPYRRYSFTMENKLFSGVWAGSFTETPEGTQLLLEEEIGVKNPIMRFIAGCFWKLEKIQQSYIADLIAKLDE